MSNRTATMSPVSADGSEWSEINQYQAGNKPEPPFSPTFSSRGNLATPPVSGGPLGQISMNGGISNGPPRRPGDPGNPSPPSSVNTRLSDGTLSDHQSRRYRRMEEALAHHYLSLRRFLQNPHQSERANKSNKARDKLLRLSATQFHELSTDVYDELVRRQQAAGGPGRPPRPDIPSFLPPRKDFHEKRNQARQKLSSLQQQRFKDLATDVFCELERRFPHFTKPDSPPVGSHSPSLRGPPLGRGNGPPNGYAPRPGSNGPPNGYPPNGFPPNGYPPNGYPGPRSQSRGPGGRGYPPGSAPNGRFPARGESLGGPPPGSNGDAIPGSDPLPKSFQSNTIVPNKSTLIEDDDDVAGMDDDYDGRSDAFALDGVLQSRPGTTTTLGDGEKRLLADTQSQVSSLQERAEELEELLKLQDREVSRLREEQEKAQMSRSERQEWEDIKADLESKVSKVENLNSSLQFELEEARMDRTNVERDFRVQLEAAQNTPRDNELQARFDDLERRHQSLQVELREQQQVTEEVRREASSFLKEMRAMSDRSNSNWEREEKLSRNVNRLEEEVKEWKGRYARAKTQLRHLRATSIGISGFRQDVETVAKENELMQQDGLVKDVHVTKFQVSIDELLRIARSGEPALLMEQIKTVVVSVRHITQDLETGQGGGDENPVLQKKAKTKVSATANNLITASKNFANSNGLSPVSLLDAAASHLTAAVVELVRMVRIRPTPADELDDDDDDNIAPMQSPGYFSVAPSQDRLSNEESVYSAISSPSSGSRSQNNSRRPSSRNGIPNGQGTMKLGFGMRRRDGDLEELKLYLEDQTEGLIQSIQALVTSIRGEDNISTIRGHISAISTLVSNVVNSTDNSMNKPDANPALRECANPIIQILAKCRDRLSKAGTDGMNPTNLREVTSKLPPIAFEIARETKELVQQIDQIEFYDADGDDFR